MPRHLILPSLLCNISVFILIAATLLAMGCETEKVDSPGDTSDVQYTGDADRDLDLDDEQDLALPDSFEGDTLDDVSDPVEDVLDGGYEDDSSDHGSDIGPDSATPSWPGTPEFVPGQPAQGTGGMTPGTGRQVFEPLVQGQDIPWERGVQGGHHIWVAVAIDDEFIVSLTDEERRAVVHRYRIWHEDGELLAETRRQGGIRSIDDAWIGIGQYAVLEAPRRPSRLDGDLLFLRAEVLLPNGDELDASLWLVSQCCD